MIPLDVMSSGFDMVSNGRGIVIFSEVLKVFGFPVRKPSFSFTAGCFLFLIEVFSEF